MCVPGQLQRGMGSALKYYECLWCRWANRQAARTHCALRWLWRLRFGATGRLGRQSFAEMVAVLRSCGDLVGSGNDDDVFLTGDLRLS